MKKSILFNFTVDKQNKKIKVERSFNAPLDLVWKAWTESEVLDQWWAPKPWRAETKSMDFKEGGQWHYAMIGPDGEKQWCLHDFKSVESKKSFSGLDAFCDKHANINNTKPRAFWNNVFNDHSNSTIVNIEISFDEPEDLETIIAMGFKEGFAMGLENLDHYLSSH